jgi:serine/threonine protein kinase
VALINDNVEIIDWGLATREDLSSTSNDNDTQYLYCVKAPEVMNGGEYTFASEMWSFGMILLSLWTCEKSFHALTDSEVSISSISFVLNDFSSYYVSLVS